MRAAGFVTLLGIALIAVPATAGQHFPYTAHVTANRAYVRSGPGTDYYPTDKLDQGDPVEVYRHDPGGWCAIRPPKRSYSWVSARYVQRIKDHLGRAQDDHVAVRVGSRFSNVREVVQVRLDRGEVVEILDEYNGGGQTWYKIAPPAGEFRWIAQRLLDTQPTSNPPPTSEHDETISRRPATGKLSAETGAARDARPTRPEHAENQPPQRENAIADQPDADQPDADQPGGQSGENGTGRPAERDARQRWTRRWNRTPSPEWKADRDQPATARSSRARASAQASRGNTPAKWPHPRAAKVETNAPAATSPADEVAQIEARLSAMVAEEATVWEFSDLKKATQKLLSKPAAPSTRDQARIILSKIARLEEIQSRARQLRPIENRGAPANAGLVTIDQARAGRLPAAASRGTRWPAREPITPVPATARSAGFDGMGTLRPVVSSKPNAPRYALVDDRTGRVLSFVSPAPGVNLQPYLGHKIGIRGNRGYISQYHRAHLMAQRVTALEGRVVR